MRIAIITFHAAINYGAVLQAYALSSYLKKMGHEAEFIQYYPSAVLGGGIKSRYKLWGLHPSDYLIAFRQVRFRAFRKKYLKETSQVFRSVEELDALSGYDAYICGSDQIWNGHITGGKLDPAYFLSFAKEGCRKIAYAASTGSDSFMDKEGASELLKSFASISVRERGLVSEAERLSEKPVQSVVDPTLLPVDYSELICPKQKRYILLYTFQRGANTYRQAKLLSKLTGLPIINIGAIVNPRKHPGKIVCPSPAQFVSLFCNADYVVTNSFHGTVFSVIFERPLFSFALTGDHASRSTRMTDFLNNVGLGDRFYSNAADLTQNDIDLASNVDWDHAVGRLKELRTISEEFLRKSLSNA